MKIPLFTHALSSPQLPAKLLSTILLFGACSGVVHASPSHKRGKPSRGAMNAWGVRHVTISVVEWGSWQNSLDLLQERTGYRHVREMIKGLKARS